MNFAFNMVLVKNGTWLPKTLEILRISEHKHFVFVSYADELAASEGRESFIKDFFSNYERNYRKNVRMTDMARKVPFVKEYAEKKLNNYFSQKHAGQVVSLEDAIFICSILEESVL